jgi:hypothetical protein
MGLFGYNSVPELNTKNMGNSLSFLSVTHTTSLLISVSGQNSG